MQRFEYKVVPAPSKGEKAKTAKTTADRFAVALMSVMNKLGAEGWDYIRADTLPCDERSGLTGTKTQFRHMLVFRRALPEVTATTPSVSPFRREPDQGNAPQLSVVPGEQPDTAEEAVLILKDKPE